MISSYFIRLTKGQHLEQPLSVHQGVPVSNIRINEDGRCVHMTSNPHLMDTAFSSVLLTVPLGVLKANAIHFTPELPDNKKKAISNYGRSSLFIVRYHNFYSDNYEALWEMPEVC